MSQLAKFDFRIAPNQQFDATIKIPKDDRGAIHGLVVDECNKPIEDAVVKLYEVEGKWDCKKTDCRKLCPLTHTFTDECGHFLFGPLCANKSYCVKIWVNDVCVTKDFAECKRDCGCLKAKPCDCARDNDKPDDCRCERNGDCGKCEEKHDPCKRC